MNTLVVGLSFLSYAADKQTNTHKQTDSNVLPTPTVRVDVDNCKIRNSNRCKTNQFYDVAKLVVRISNGLQNAGCGRN